MLEMLDNGNRASGGLGKAKVFFGIAGKQPILIILVYRTLTRITRLYRWMVYGPSGVGIQKADARSFICW